jgi:hypothetical protein
MMLRRYHDKPDEAPEPEPSETEPDETPEKKTTKKG